MNHQLPLGFRFADEISFETFQAGNNAELIEALKSLGLPGSAGFNFLWGASGSGKSHLLQAAVRLVAQQQKPVAYVPLISLDGLNPIILQGLEQMALVCIDDIQVIAGNKEWEEAMFYCFNHCHEQNTPLVITSNVLPQQAGFTLKDLESRLSWGVTFHLHEMNDEQKKCALQVRAEARGMQLADDVCQFLITRHSRHTSDLFQLLDELDKASLAAQRKLTIPFVRQFISH